MAELYGGEVCFKRDEKRCCTLHNSKGRGHRVSYKWGDLYIYIHIFDMYICMIQNILLYLLYI